jgi:6-phosphogluconolactonase
VTASEHPDAQPSEIAVRPDGRYLYVAIRGADTISVIALDGPAPAYVTEVPTGGHWPRHFAIIGEHLYVANERSHSVVAFRLNEDSGVPEEPGIVTPLSSPTCVLPAKSF